MAALAAAFSNLTLRGKDPIHRADRAKTDAFIEQGGKDLSRGLIGEAGCAQMPKASVSAMILLVMPPRERPMAWL